MTIIDALRDGDLFGRLPRFKGLRTWRAWIVFLKALFGLPLDGDEMAMYQACTGRIVPPIEEVEEAAAIVGRRGGKSNVAALIAVFMALLRDWRPYLAPGERAHVVVIAQNQRAARVVLNYIRAFLRSIPAFAGEVLAERAEEIDLCNGVTIGVWPSTYRATRGLTIIAAILDEIDYWWQESINAAEEVVAAVRPAMATIPGSKLIAISSPYVSTGWLHAFFRAHWGNENSDALVWKAASRTMNPTLSEERIAAAMAEDPERGRAEWEAEWRVGVSAAFDPELVDACVRTEPLVIPVQQGVIYAAGIDPSGGGAEEFAWSIAHREDERIIVDLVQARGRRGRLPLDLEAAVADCVADLTGYGIREVVGDRYAGAWVVEAFRKHGITYRHSEHTKSEVYLELLPLVTTGRVELCADAEVIRQAKLLERKRGAQGKDTIDHPPGGRDDRINAAAMAVTQVAASAASPKPIAARILPAAVRAAIRENIRW